MRDSPRVTPQAGSGASSPTLPGGSTEGDPAALRGARCGHTLGSTEHMGCWAEALQEDFSEEEAPSLRLSGTGQWGEPGSVQRWVWEAWQRRNRREATAGGLRAGQLSLTKPRVCRVRLIATARSDRGGCEGHPVTAHQIRGPHWTTWRPRRRALRPGEGSPCRGDELGLFGEPHG